MEVTGPYSGLELIFGPMFAGKTTELVRRLNLYNEMDLNVLYINSSIDTRSNASFSTHNNTLKEHHQIVSMKCNSLHGIIDTAKDYDVIGIDEAQFFNTLYDDVKHLVDDLGKKVIVSGLDADFKREPFGDIIKLVPLCDSVIKLKPFCKYCRDNKKIVPAVFTSKHNDKERAEGNIDVGGYDKYFPTCRSCYHKHNKSLS